MEKSQFEGKHREIELSTQTMLEKKLEMLKNRLSLSDQLQVIWMPNKTSRLSGEIKGVTIFIYEPDANQVFEILVHELVDYLVSKAIEPYRKVTNSLIKIINQEAYKKKEKIVETISTILIKQIIDS